MTRRATVRDRRGQSLVEFALILPILLVLLLGVFDFGRAIYAFNAVSNAAREGARTAIVDQSQSAGVYRAAQEAANQGTGLGLDPADTNEVAVAFPDPYGTCVGCRAVVTVQYQFQAITPVIGTLVGPLTLSSTTSIPVERTNPTP